ncbi:MAG TPA: hypothetical protein VFE32_17565 [Puia sp.]|jgi:hypothetical protein|nr:hypothetical protein [Puia sp.]
MAYAPYTNLKATPDFAFFQFTSPTQPDPTIRQVRFNQQQNGRVYLVDFQSYPAGKKEDRSWPETEDFLCVLLTIVQIIEIYSERYPRRLLLFNVKTPLHTLVFGSIVLRYAYLLFPVFMFEPEKPETADEKARHCPLCPRPDKTERIDSFVLRRLPFPYFSTHTVESTWKGTSQIFNTRFSIELDKTTRVSAILPPT